MSQYIVWKEYTGTTEKYLSPNLQPPKCNYIMFSFFLYYCLVKTKKHIGHVSFREKTVVIAVICLELVTKKKKKIKYRICMILERVYYRSCRFLNVRSKLKTIYHRKLFRTKLVANVFDSVPIPLFFYFLSDGSLKKYILT